MCVAVLDRPLWVEYPKDEETFQLESEFLVGTDLLVAPVTEANANSVQVYFPGSQPWYDIETFQRHSAPARKTVAAPLRKIPVYQRGGSIIPRKERIRRSSSLTHNDPFTLVAALDEQVGRGRGIGKQVGVEPIADSHASQPVAA